MLPAAPLSLEISAALGLAGSLIAAQPWLLRRLWRLWQRDRFLRQRYHRLGVLRRSWPLAGAVLLLLHAGLLGIFWFTGGALSALPLLLGLAAATLMLALVDWRCLWLPDSLVVPLGLLGAAASLLWGDPWFWPLLGAALSYACFALLRFAYRHVRGREGLGGGDVHLAAAMGAWLGPLDLPFAIFLASLIGLGAALFLMAGKDRHSTRLPFGSFLGLALFGSLVLKLTA